MNRLRYKVLSLSETRGGAIGATELETRLNEFADQGYTVVPITVPNRIVLELHARYVSDGVQGIGDDEVQRPRAAGEAEEAPS
jgi:hypothetical protein